MIHVDLLPKQRRAALQRRARSRQWMLGGSAYAALIAIAGLTFSLSGPRVSVAADLYQRQERELTDRQSRVDSLTAQSDLLAKRLDRLTRIQGHPDVSALVRLIASELQDHIVLDSISMERQVQSAKDAGRKKVGADAKDTESAATPTVFYQIDIAGLAKDQPDVTSFVLRLEGLGLFDKVTVLESGKRDVQSAELAQFRLRCRVDHRPAPSPQSGKGAEK